MLELVETPVWTDIAHKNYGLECGGKCSQMAYIYGLFADKLSAEERKLAVDATYEKGIRPMLEQWLLPETKIHAFDTMGHNWWPVCVSHAAHAAVVMKDEIPDGDALVSAACKGLEAWFAYKGNPINAKPVSFDNGGFYESVNYLDYTLHTYLRFADTYQHIMGRHPFDDVAYLENCARFYANTMYPSGKKAYVVGFGDSNENEIDESHVWMIRYGIRTDEIRWYLQNCVQDEGQELNKALFYDEIYGEPVHQLSQMSAAYDKIG